MFKSDSNFIFRYIILLLKIENVLQLNLIIKNILKFKYIYVLLGKFVYHYL